MKPSEINSKAKEIVNKYLKNKVITELKGYAKFFTKPEIIQPTDEATTENMLKLCNLVIDLQTVRERVVIMFLDIKKAKNRLQRLEMELQSSKKDLYVKQKNAEQRNLFLFEKAKMVAVGLKKAKMLTEMAELVLSLIDSHVWALKANNKVLASAPSQE